MSEANSTEKAILQAAEREFLTKGLVSSKTTEIAKAAGVTHAMLHYYFRTKDNLFEQVFQEKVKILVGSFNALLVDEGPILERVQKGIEAHFEVLRANPLLPRFIVNEIITNVQRKESYMRMLVPILKSIFERIEPVLREEAEKGTIRYIAPLDLLLNAISLNAFVFMASPLMESLVQGDSTQLEAFLNHRKEENVTLILARLRV